MYFIVCQLVDIFTGTWIVNPIRQSNNTISINKIKHLYKDPNLFPSTTTTIINMLLCYRIIIEY